MAAGWAAALDTLKKPLQILRSEVQNRALSAKERTGLMGAKLLKPNKNISVIFHPWHNRAEKQKENLRKDKASCTGRICRAWKCLQHRCSKRNHRNCLFCGTYKMLHASKCGKQGGGCITASRGGGICRRNRYINQGGLTSVPVLPLSNRRKSLG